MAVADDAQLVKLAAHRARDLLPILHRADALTPLLLIIAILPGLSGLTRYDFGEDGARWGLKYLEAHFSAKTGGPVMPAQLEPASVSDNHPPLGSWLTAAVMSAVGPASPFALTLVPYLSFAGLVVISSILFQKLCGARTGFLTALLLACHGPALEMIKTPAPYALSLFLAVVAFWGILSHLQGSDGIVSFSLLIGGIAMGLCFLSAGPLALIVIAVLLAHIVLTQKKLGNGNGDQATERRRHSSAWIAIRSLCLSLLTAFAVSGWWYLMMWSRNGAAFFSGWLSSTVHGEILSSQQATSDIPASYPGFVIHRMISQLGLLVGLSLFGFGRAAIDVFRTRKKSRQYNCSLLFAWTVLAALIMLGLVWDTRDTVYDLTLLRGFLLVPLIASAAFAVDEIASRRVSIRMVLAILFLTLALLAGKPLLAEVEQGNVQFAAEWALILIVPAALIIWRVGIICRDNDARQKIVIGGSLLGLILFNAAWGLSSFQREDSQSRALTAFRDRLASETDSEFHSTLLITQNGQSNRVRLLIRSLLPESDFRIVPDWDAAMTRALSVRPGPADKQLIVDWEPRENRASTRSIPGLELKEIVLSRHVHQGRLRAFIVSSSADEAQK